MRVFPLPLYHGTSTAFTASIIQRGLGAHDPVRSSQGVECLARLLSIADDHLASSEDWMSERISIEAMTLQCVTAGNMNFRHGSTYLSPSQATAVRYALSNSHGSELLSSCIGLYQRLRTANASLVTLLEREFPEIHSLSSMEPTPVLVELKTVAVDSLRTEQGEQPQQQISRVLNSTGSMREALLQQFNFELRLPISAEDLLLHRICEWKMNDLSIEYTLEPYAASDA